MDAVFRALNDFHRRAILDLLRKRDGQSLGEIEAFFDDITRFGVMKHLNVLEDAGLLTTRKAGRFKYHYLNAAPLQEISDRWISRFAASWVQPMADLKNQLEKETIVNKPRHVFVTIIKTTPAKLWTALTDGKITPDYYYGATLEGEMKAGKDYRYMSPDKQVSFTLGKILEVVEQKKLVMSFKGEWMPGMENDALSRVTYEIEQQGDCCRLTLIHDEFEGETATYKNSGNGWPGILSGLKTLLETGKPLAYNPMAA